MQDAGEAAGALGGLGPAETPVCVEEGVAVGVCGRDRFRDGRDVRAPPARSKHTGVRSAELAKPLSRSGDWVPRRGIRTPELDRGRSRGILVGCPAPEDRRTGQTPRASWPLAPSWRRRCCSVTVLRAGSVSLLQPDASRPWPRRSPTSSSAAPLRGRSGPASATSCGDTDRPGGVRRHRSRRAPIRRPVTRPRSHRSRTWRRVTLDGSLDLAATSRMPTTTRSSITSPPFAGSGRGRRTCT